MGPAASAHHLRSISMARMLIGKKYGVVVYVCMMSGLLRKPRCSDVAFDVYGLMGWEWDGRGAKRRESLTL